MNTIIFLFGEGKELDPLQMSMRAIVVFIIGLLLVRFSGRRSFGMRMPFDNVITILLGAILSRAVSGASPFWATIAASAAIVCMHRLFAWIGLYSDKFDCIIKGKSQILYENGELHKDIVKKCLVTDKDLIEGVRINSNLNSLEETEKIFVERDGQISVVKKKI